MPLAVGQVVTALLSCALLVAHTFQWRGDWSCRLFLEHGKWRWCDAQIGYNYLWPSLLERAWGEQAPWAGSQLLWLCVVHWEVTQSRRKAKISGFNHSTAVVSGKSDSQLLGSPLCKARWVWPSLWVLGGGVGEQSGCQGWAEKCQCLSLISNPLARPTSQKEISDTHYLPWAHTMECPPFPNARHKGLWASLCWSSAFICRDQGRALLGCPCPHLPAPGQPLTRGTSWCQPCDWCTWPRTSLLPAQETGGLGR